ncbi:MAG: AAA family ATPase [Candidatus Lokiarchaeota archaeon]|nr:AAA family ATPase [Candidatus Lokiarchaeota archaeon]
MHYCNGSHETGTSSVSRRLANRLESSHFSAGDEFRKAAKRTGIPIAEFNKILGISTEMKEQLDNRLRKIAMNGNCVIEGRLADSMAGDYADLKVLLKAPLDIRVERIANRDGLSSRNAKKETIQREKEERQTFIDLYDIDLEDWSIYDLIIDTTNF